MKFSNDNEEKVIKIKQSSKVALHEIEDGLGNTTNQNSDGIKRCVGCGIAFQTEDERKPGFVLDNVRQDYCLRCFKIKNYGRLVEQEINDKDFIAILEEINNSSSQIRYYYVVDIFDLPGSRLEWLEKMIATKEVIILVNKIDLVPKVVSKDKIIAYVKKYFGLGVLKDAKIMLTSSVKKEHVFPLVEAMKTVTYDQYIVGVSNAGKSSLINACLYANQQAPSVVTSKYVNTTLDKIKINFTKENYVYDTPGLVKHNHIAIATAPSYWDYFFFQKEVKQVTYQLQSGQSIFYGGVAWFNYVGGAQTDETGKELRTSFHFYINRRMPLHRTKTDNGEKYFRSHRHALAPRLKDKDAVFTTHTFKFTKEDNVDIHISGLGWINVKTFPGLHLEVVVPTVDNGGIKVSLLPALIS
jgi:ribosome biogenesis GTPase YqeH